MRSVSLTFCGAIKIGKGSGGVDRYSIIYVIVYTLREMFFVMNEYIYLGAMWAVWCSLHSLFITSPVKTSAKERLGSRFKWYRLVYNLLSLITVAPIVLYLQWIRGEYVFVWDDSLLPVKYIFWCVSVVLIVGGILSYDIREFLGLQQLKVNSSSVNEERFVVKGIHRWVRHPWYSAVFVLLWARDLTKADIVTAVVLSIYVLVGTYLEERRMVGSFGDEYRKYKSEVPAYIPWKIPG